MGASPSDDMIARVRVSVVQRCAAIDRGECTCRARPTPSGRVLRTFPKFVTLLRNVRRIDDTQFSYTWHPDGEERHGVIHIVLQIPCR